MADNHRLTLLDSEMEEICQVVERMRVGLFCRHISGDMIVLSALEAMSGPTSSMERSKFTELLLRKLHAFTAAMVTPNTERTGADHDSR
jgi:hypothetical protein